MQKEYSRVKREVLARAPSPSELFESAAIDPPPVPVHDSIETWAIINQCGFVDSLRGLADRAGASMPSYTPEEQRGLEAVHAFRRVYRLYLEYAREELAKSGPARRWLKGRGLIERTVEVAALGFCPTGKTVLDRLLNEGYGEDLLLDCGIARRRQKDGQVYDGFYGCIVFPWFEGSELVYLTGRAAKQVKKNERKNVKLLKHGPFPVEPPPAYLPLGSLAGDPALVCEGEIDALTLCQAGIEDRAIIGVPGIASIGPGLRELLADVERIELLMDLDGGGKRGLERAMKGLDISKAWVVEPAYPEKVKDPNDLLQVTSRDDSVEDPDQTIREAIDAAIAQAKTIIDWTIDSIESAKLDLRSRARSYSDKVLPMVAQLDGLELELYTNALTTGRGRAFTKPTFKTELTRLKNLQRGEAPAGGDQGEEEEPIKWPETFKGGNKVGLPLPHSELNIRAMLDHYGITIRRNLMTHSEEILVPTMAHSEAAGDAAMDKIKLLARKHGLQVPATEEAVSVIQAENYYHPVAEWIASKPWDGVSRLAEFFTTAIKLADDYPEWIGYELFYRWMISAVKAACVPVGKKGISVQGVLTLVGRGNIGKTRFLLSLAPKDTDWVKDGVVLDPTNRDHVQKATSHWIVELGEVDATFRRSDVAALKSFLTENCDQYRAPYARKDETHPRRTVFAATVNRTDFLVDETGNRRYFTLVVIRCKPDHGFDMQQVWAEAKAKADAGEPHWLSDQMVDALALVNRSHEKVSIYSETLLQLYGYSDEEWSDKAEIRDAVKNAMGNQIWSNRDDKQLEGALRAMCSTKCGRPVPKIVKGRRMWPLSPRTPHRLPLEEQGGGSGWHGGGYRSDIDG